MKKILYIALVALCVVACTPPDVDQTKLFLTEDQAQALLDKGEELTIEELKARYMTEEGNYCLPELYRNRSKAGNHYLFSIDTIPASKTPIYIRGRVTTDDYAGNFYKTLCIQQVFVNGSDTTQQALRLSVDAGSIGGLYQLGQEILIRVDGLAIGRYANQPQLCLPSYNNNIYAGDYSKDKVGWAAGRIPAAIFKARTQCIGLPDQSKLYYEPMLITKFYDETDLEDTRSMDAKLVRIKNVHYTGTYEIHNNAAKCNTEDPENTADNKGENANVFAPTTQNMNYPQSRVIADNNGNETFISTSEYAKFAHFYLPGADKNGVANCPKYVGDIVGILGFYYDNGKNFTKYPPAGEDWSITIRSVDDLRLYDGDEHWLYDENGNYKPGYEYSKK